MIDRPRGIALAAIGVGVVVLLIVGGTQEPREAPPTTIADLDVPDPAVPPPPPPPPPVTTTTRPPPPPVIGAQTATEITDAGIDRLVVIVGSPEAGHEVRAIDSAGTRFVPLPLDAENIAISPELEWVAFTVEADLGIADLEAETVSLGLTPGVVSLAWSGPNTLVWSTGSGVITGRPDPDGVAIEDSTPLPDATIAGATDAGIWVILPSEFGRSITEVRFLPADGSAPEPTYGDLIHVPSAGPGALIANLEFDGWDWLFAWFDGALTPLPWAPWDAGVAGVLAAVTQDRLAFVGTTDAIDWVEVWTADGSGGERWGLPSRISGVRWSRDGSQLVLPSQEGVLVVDPTGPSIALIVVREPVLDAAIAP